jgi:2OG-Fe(II) oxygenase superfamily
VSTVGIGGGGWRLVEVGRDHAGVPPIAKMPFIQLGRSLPWPTGERSIRLQRFIDAVTSFRRTKTVLDMIIVKDNFLDVDLCNLIAKSAEAYEWRYWLAVPDDPANNRYFVSFLWTDTSSEDNLFRMLWRLIFPIVQGCYCYRIIANGQVKGQNGNWHTDHSDKTVLYFPLAWDPEWGGSLRFKIGDSEKEIEYKQNRIVIFDSSIRHYGSCPTVDNILRVSIAFNLRNHKANRSA